MRSAWLFILTLPLSGAQPLPAPAPTAPSTPAGAFPRTQPLPLPQQAVSAASPVDFFRRLLALPPEERQKAVATRSAQARELLENKLLEFEALSAPERESRLRTLELRWHLLPLMKLAPTNRAERLAAVPETVRSQVNRRLLTWDLLPPALQQEVLQNETALRYFWSTQEAGASAKAAPSHLPPAQQAKLEAELARWNALPQPTRQRITGQFERFFDLSAREKGAILEAMSDKERRQLEVALKQFGSLPEADRNRVLSGFRKFAALSPAERERFLKNAQRWQALTPKDRRVWRDMVSRVAAYQATRPIMPPGAGLPLPPTNP